MRRSSRLHCTFPGRSLICSLTISKHAPPTEPLGTHLWNGLDTNSSIDRIRTAAEWEARRAESSKNCHEENRPFSLCPQSHLQDSWQRLNFPPSSYQMIFELHKHFLISVNITWSSLQVQRTHLLPKPLFRTILPPNQWQNSRKCSHPENNRSRLLTKQQTHDVLQKFHAANAKYQLIRAKQTNIKNLLRLKPSLLQKFWL